MLSDAKTVVSWTKLNLNSQSKDNWSGLIPDRAGAKIALSEIVHHNHVRESQHDQQEYCARVDRWTGWMQA